jgi:hypothetical protein
MAWQRWSRNSGQRFVVAWTLVLLLQGVMFYGLSMAIAVAGWSGSSCGAQEIITVPVQQVKAGVAGQLLIDVQFPAGYHLNPRAPLQYSVEVMGAGLSIASQDRERQILAPSFPLAIPFQTAMSRHDVTVAIDMTFYYCRADDTGVCVIQSVHWQALLHIRPESHTTTPGISYQAAAPEVQRPL